MQERLILQSPPVWRECIQPVTPGSKADDIYLRARASYTKAGDMCSCHVTFTSEVAPVKSKQMTSIHVTWHLLQSGQQLYQSRRHVFISCDIYLRAGTIYIQADDTCPCHVTFSSEVAPVIYIKAGNVQLQQTTFTHNKLYLFTADISDHSERKPDDIYL